MSHSYQTINYRGCWIHSHCDGPNYVVRWQGADGIQHPACTMRAAKANITRHLRALGLIDKPHTPRLIVSQQAERLAAVTRAALEAAP